MCGSSVYMYGMTMYGSRISYREAAKVFQRVVLQRRTAHIIWRSMRVCTLSTCEETYSGCWIMQAVPTTQRKCMMQLYFFRTRGIHCSRSDSSDHAFIVIDVLYACARGVVSACAHRESCTRHMALQTRRMFVYTAAVSLCIQPHLLNLYIPAAAFTQRRLKITQRSPRRHTIQRIYTYIQLNAS